MRGVVLVTGASSGIGAAAARELATRGWTVYGGCRNPMRPGIGIPGVTMLALDVTSEVSVNATVSQILTAVGHIDALVCCAGMGVAGSVEDIPATEIAVQMDTNFSGVVRCVKACLPAMRQARSGRILVVGSMAGRTGMPFQAFYSASKYALEGFVESLRYEIRVFGLEAGIIEPGDYKTGFTDARRMDTHTEAGPYASACAATMEIQMRDERSGHNPVEAGKAIARMLESRRMPTRRTIGPLFERFAMGAKRIIPAWLYERFYRYYYRLP